MEEEMWKTAGGEEERQHETETHGDRDINRKEDRDRNESVFPAPSNLPAQLGYIPVRSCCFSSSPFSPRGFCIHCYCYRMWQSCSCTVPDAPLRKHWTTSIETSSCPPWWQQLCFAIHSKGVSVIFFNFFVCLLLVFCILSLVDSESWYTDYTHGKGGAWDDTEVLRLNWKENVDVQPIFTPKAWFMLLHWICPRIGMLPTP